MNKFLCGILLLINVFICEAQTCYYRLTKVKDKQGEEHTNVKGGQFITFTPKYCYESDSKGFTVNNGKLTFRYIEGDIMYYSGTAYWGNCIFAFSPSKSILNVVTEKGDIYVYHKSVTPDNVITSSLIKKKLSGTSSFGVLIPQPFGNGSVSIHTSVDVQTGEINKNSHTESGTSAKTCHICLGTGICSTCNGKGWYYNPFGTGTVECPNCDRAHNGVCSRCHGQKTIIY